ncbi:MAG: hypothetical protein LBP67_04760 [Bacteroidales bacterium]|jgi:hypothetical protein|nr:hypothetical protein [Bacteroidales bacterium]
MKGKYFLIISGVLLALCGLIFLINNIIVIGKLAAWSELETFGDKAFRVGTVILPLLWIISGVFGILLGILQSDRLFTLANQVGTRINLITITIFGGYIAACPLASSYYFENLGHWFGFSAESNALWIILYILIGIIVIYYTGLEAASEEWNRFVITRFIMRVIIIAVFIPIFISGLDVKEFKGLPPFVFTLFAFVCIGVFNIIGYTPSSDNMFQIIKKKAIGVVWLFAYYMLCMLIFAPIVRIILTFPPTIQYIILIASIVIGLGKGGTSGDTIQGTDGHTYTRDSGGSFTDNGGTRYGRL